MPEPPSSAKSTDGRLSRRVLDMAAQPEPAPRRSSGPRPDRENMKSVVVHVPPEVHARLKVIAKRQRRTLSGMMLAVIDDLLAAHPPGS